jgi:hypothetical protein
MILEVFNRQSEGKIEQKSSNFYIWFSMSAKIIEGQLYFMYGL